MNIRIVSIRGKFTLCYVEVDEFQQVERVLEEVELRSNCHKEIAEIIKAMGEATKFPITQINACNRDMLIRND